MRINDYAFWGNFHEAFFSLASEIGDPLFCVFEKRKINKFILNYCKSREVPFFVISNVIPDYLSCCSNFNFVCSFGILFKQRSLNNGVYYNIHPGVLPQYRGRHPLPQAILNQEKQGGVTIHTIVSEGIDLGPIWSQKKIKLDYDKSYYLNELRVRSCIPEAVHVALERIFSDSNPIGFSNSNNGFYYKPIERNLLKKITTSSCIANIRSV